MLPTQSWVGHELNCGFNRVRFVSPVRVGAEVRAEAKLVRVKKLGHGGGGGGDAGGVTGVESIVAVTVHGRGGGGAGERRAESGDIPVMVAEWVTRQYAKA